MAQEEWSVVSETPIGAADASGWEVASETPIAPVQQLTPQQMERYVGPSQPRNPNSMTADQYRAQVAAREAKGYDRTLSGTALDAGITLLKSAIGLPEAFVGLADIPTLGRVGKFLEQAGYKPNEAKEILDTYLSEAQQAANRRVKETKGFLPTVGAAIQNPSTIATTAGESLAPMLGGAGVARGVLKAAPKVAPYLAGAIGEGILGAGSAAEQIRQETEDKLLTGKQALSAVGSGVGTAAFGVAGGKLAKKLGLDDIDTMLVTGAKQAVKETGEPVKQTVGKSLADFAKKATASGISEGVFEELPQSAQEQMWMNYATDKPLMDGVAEASAMGLVTGAGMGVGATTVGTLARRGKAEPTEKTKVEPTLDAWEVEEETPIAPVDKRQALKDALAAKVTKLRQPTTTVPSETAPTEVAAEVQPAPTPEFEALVEKYKKRGFMAEDAATLARNDIEESKSNAPTQKGAKDVAEPVSETSGAGTAIPAQPADNVPAPTGLGETKRDGVVSAGEDVGKPAEGEAAKPTAVTAEEELDKKSIAETTSLSFDELRNKTKEGVSAPGTKYTATHEETKTDEDGNRVTTPVNTEYKVARMDGGWTVVSDADGSNPVLLPPSRAAANTDEQLVEQRNNEAQVVTNTKVKPAPKAAPTAVTADEKQAAFEAKKARVESIARTNASTAFDQVNDPAYNGDIQLALESYEGNMGDTLEEEGFKNDPDYADLYKAANRAFAAEVNKLKGTTSGTETPKAVQTKEEGQEAPTAGAVTKKEKGRPPLVLTEEERAEKEKNSRANKAAYMKGERALPKLQTALDKANAPINEDNYADDLELSVAQDEQRAAKRDAINALMDLEAKHRGSPLGKRAKDALADRTKITQKEHDDVLAGRKYKSQERVNKSTASNEEVEAADEGFKKAKNAAQAINQVIKTGTGFQKYLAKRLRGLVNGVKFVVVEETDPLPEQLSRHQEAWGNDNSRARGVYFENTATGEKIIYVRGASAGEFQGINNTTVLHELLHAATQQKLEMALLAVQRGFSGDAKLVRAYNDLIAVMNNAKDEYNRLSNLGQLPTDIYYLKTVSGVFSNPHEFVSYGMTDPYFQKFLMGAYGFEEETGLFNRFVDAIRELLGMGTDTVNALSDLIVVTDKILNAKLTPTMQMIVKADKANAVREGRGEKVSAEKAKAKANSKKVSAAEKKIARSKEAQEVVDGIDTLVTLRDPVILMDALASMWSAMNVKKLQALLPSIQTNILVEWGTNLGITHMDKTWRAMQDMSAMRMKMLGGASDVVTKWLEVQPGLYGKLIKGKKNELNDLSAVMHYATDKSIDPATSKKDPTLNKMWDSLSDKAKEIYIDVRDYYKANFDLYRLLLNNRIDAMKIPGNANDPDTPKGKLMAEIKKMYETAKGLSPYFPLMRYGDYWLRVGSGKKKEFYMFESVADRELFMRQRVRDLQKEGDTRTLAQMKADQDIETGNDLKGLRDKSISNDTAPLLKEIFELIGEGISETDAETLKDQIYQLYLTTMPEQSFRRQFIHRKGTAGFSGDALRNFITSSTNMANQLSRLKYGPQMIREVDSAKENLKGNPEKDKLEMLVNELGERVQLDVYPPAVDSLARGVANVANKSAFLYFMTSVKTAVVQFSSLPIFGAPVLMSRHSPARVVAEMGKMMLIFNDVGVVDKDGKLSLPTLANSRRVKMNEEEQRAVEAMVDRGVSEITMAYDLMDRRKTPSAKYAAAWKTTTNMMGALFHHVERLNREVMFMTSFRLSRKEGMSFDDAVDQAVKDTYDALGNFSEQNRPRIMRGPVGRTLLQFKTYPMFVSTYLVRNGYRAMAGMDAAAKKEAATQLFGTLFMSGLLAGYVGVPGVSAAMGAIQGLINAFRDDDDDDPLEERDIEFWFRNVFIPDFFGEMKIGDYKVSDLINSGLIDTVTGFNMSSSLSMNNMWVPELKEQRMLEDTMQQYALSLGGPSASLVLNQIPSGIRLLMEGKTMQGLEKLLPAALRQPLTAYRYSQEGATTSTGAIIKDADEFTRAQLAAQAAGARTTGLASRQEDLFKANALKAKVVNDKAQIVNRLDLEAIRGDDDAFDDALEKLLVFNLRNPQVAVKGEQLSKMLKNRMEKRLKADRGFNVDKQFYPYLEDLLEPSRERLEKESAWNVESETKISK